ncbi:MAG: hypothetical protein VYC05_07980 [Verrucomicrobiota bacterium]|nr:hypothetical protein [Verrucomicrobiales bacterium]MEC9041754.1 hypothetical protein [Verrucomicrobiota bacterium]MEC9112521.1 hypothetical protein [Verrucomicrobiota bacterium]MED5457818.1 hypothetical protein [Verrucomicrobiota bacterium]MEE2725304.1 hypothetical protein [Verrucomicrobiota bacterium]
MKLGKEYEMSEEKTNNGIENKVKSLEERINALEIKLEIEREDLDKLKEVSDRDHRKLQKISYKSPPPPTAVSPVGL